MRIVAAIGRLSYTVSPDGVTTNYGYTPERLLTHKDYKAGPDTFYIDYTIDNFGRTRRIDYPETGGQRSPFGMAALLIRLSKT